MKPGSVFLLGSISHDDPKSSSSSSSPRNICILACHIENMSTGNHKRRVIWDARGRELRGRRASFVVGYLSYVTHPFV